MEEVNMLVCCHVEQFFSIGEKSYTIIDIMGISVFLMSSGVSDVKGNNYYVFST